MTRDKDDQMWTLLWERLDKIDDKQDFFAELQVKHTAILDEHHRRSTNIEKRVEQVASEMHPMLLREAVIARIAKWVGTAGVTMGLVWVALQIGRFFKVW